MVIDQALSKLPSEMAIYLKDRNPRTSEDLTKMADQFVFNRGGPNYWKRREADQAAKKHNSNGKVDSPKSKDTSDKKGTSHSEKGSGPKCFQCGQLGHIRRYCPNQNVDKTSTEVKEKTALKCEQHGTEPAKARMAKCMLPGFVEGREVEILRDTACTQSAVSADVVPPECYLPGQSIAVRGIGGTVYLPVAMIELKCKLISGKVKVVVVEGLESQFLLGHDLDLTSGENTAKEICVLKRAQARREQIESHNNEIHASLVKKLPNDNKVCTEEEYKLPYSDLSDAEVRDVYNNDADVADAHNNIHIPFANVNDNDVNHVEGAATPDVEDNDPQVKNVGKVGPSSPHEEPYISKTKTFGAKLEGLEITREELIQLQKADHSLLGIHDRMIVSPEKLSKQRVGFFLKMVWL
ncbi:hypothetical protein HOLleu_42078 [Holothuria leucospilota]|uniref:CCHC-type domain-containing protein n=1 Tax=Holothuria leucospilota TaxID=206669 RepID=A0A9Q1BAB7_HOLLE|nr:hypothetical protein HOLleu_42078 [Holothuria leucospilota]